MKLMIEIPEDRYDEIHSLKFVMYGLQSEENRKLFNRLINAVQDSTPIPDNATNGDVLSSIFNIDIKNKLVHDDITAYEITIDLGTNWTTLRINKDWWNAPYQKVGKE